MKLIHKTNGIEAEVIGMTTVGLKYIIRLEDGRKLQLSKNKLFELFEEMPDDSNVVFVDFKYKFRFNNRKEWQVMNSSKKKSKVF